MLLEIRVLLLYVITIPLLCYVYVITERCKVYNCVGAGRWLGGGGPLYTTCCLSAFTTDKFQIGRRGKQICKKFMV